MTTLTFATRKSALALAQSRAFASGLVEKNPGLTVGELHITTSGDRFTDRPLQDIGGKGLFIKELEEALLDGRADFAVHSIKDVPGELVPGLHIACIPEREDPRDVLVTKSGARLAELPTGALVGTSSLRRSLSLQTARPDLRIEPLRGNVDTRLRKVTDGEYDGIVLAYAGLKRLGLEGRATEVLEPSVCLPAVGQGALGIECKEGNGAVEEALQRIDHKETSIVVSAERAFMKRVGGNCRMPIAAYAVREADELFLRAFLAEPDGTRPRRGERRVAWPTSREEARRVGDDLAAELTSP
ncbi:MAG: hydroxymethylbilane synthase [Myxococcales bacterium]|nr:hydroxymethylbilane synthase [Myxococcales bacterium]